MYLSTKFKLIPPILTPNEKACNFQNLFYQLPNSLAYLARKQLKLVDKINNHRIKLANIYKQELKNFQFPKEEKKAKNIYF
jgi:dTDP-4-amino-4,6-dideoxygalactose transaminase